MDAYNQWKIKRWHAPFLGGAVLLGVGWWQYQDDPNAYTRRLLRATLSNKRMHSVRDGYTAKKLQAIGFNNIVNTSCPTLWPLADLDPAEIPQRKSDTVLLMVTDYHPKPEVDRLWLQTVSKHYQRVFFWPQGRGDLAYFAQLGIPATQLEHSMASFESFIARTPAFDYVGTRLHGGVRCLLARRRSLILEIDNRTPEIARETNLPAVPRENLAAIESWINGGAATKITLNHAAIRAWKDQFAC